MKLVGRGEHAGSGPGFDPDSDKEADNDDDGTEVAVRYQVSEGAILLFVSLLAGVMLSSIGVYLCVTSKQASMLRLVGWGMISGVWACVLAYAADVLGSLDRKLLAAAHVLFVGVASMAYVLGSGSLALAVAPCVGMAVAFLCRRAAAPSPPSV